MTVPDDTVWITIGVEHSEKMRRQLSARVLYSEIFLVIAHHRDQDLLGKLQEFAFEVAQDHGGKFSEIDHSIQQLLEREFLQLPEEVLVTVIRDDQKYFAVEDAKYFW